MEGGSANHLPAKLNPRPGVPGLEQEVGQARSGTSCLANESCQTSRPSDGVL